MSPASSASPISAATASVMKVKISTSKQWVLPPRPKPGRKPSLDTPTTKRKAQNRAAQRAFRERKANKIQELELSLGELKLERNNLEIGLTNLNNDHNILNSKFQTLLVENKNLSDKANRMSKKLKSKQCPTCDTNAKSPNIDQSDIISNLSSKITYLERILDDKNNEIKRLQNSRGYGMHSPNFMNSNASFVFNNQNHHQHQHGNNSNASSTSSLPTPSSHHASPFSVNDPSTSTTGLTDDNENDDDCGACEKDDCICESIGIKKAANNASSIIREQIKLDQKEVDQAIQNFVPVNAVPLKRKLPSDGNEIDFTSQYSKNSSRKQQKFARFIQKAKDSKTNNINKDKNMNYALSSSNTTSKSSSSSSTSSSSSSDIFSNAALFKSIVSKDMDSIEPCGFCSDDTPCVCREASKEVIRSMDANSFQPQMSIDGHDHDNSNYSGHSESIPKITLLANPTSNVGGFSDTLQLPKVKESLMDSVNKEFNISKSKDAENDSGSGNVAVKSGCTGNPGTCLQCQSDPLSTLFCTTIASKVSDERSRPISKPQAKTPPIIQAPPPKIRRSNSSSLINLPVITDAPVSSTIVNTNSSFSTASSVNANGKQLFIPCSDAYKTLSRHESFKKMDFNTIVGKLTTRGMQVEVRSVVNVLRELDRRLYQ
ncbi:hypothetical protein DASC09_057310 [Saccharomycopsis crataegensis]|uniref:BZIP domain-containing protein n=1 Tax=Saccharomycopsis crataegensis TaxID=43959 RepID=A0AAV5QVE2_9ASCO|nr:hypothetical protein DASC09_057310 [Saccharomycopsis crataegensis]